MFGYQRILYPEIYSDIDAMYYSNGAGMKCYFICNVGSRPSEIQMKFTGATSVSIVSNKLKIVSSIGSLTFQQPTAYQIDGNGNIVTLNWQPSYSSLGGNKFTFTLGSYDATKPLIIMMKKGNPPPSPQNTDNLKWSTYFGGPNIAGNTEECSDIKTDEDGNIYVSGTSDYHSFPISTGITSGALGLIDAFAVKFSSIAIPLWISYYGGTQREFNVQIGVNDLHKVFISGITTSTDLPLQDFNPGVSYYATSGGGFIARFNEFGNNLDWSSHIPGISSVDQMISSTIEFFGPATIFYLVGSASSGFPLKQDGSAFYQSNGSNCGYILGFIDDCTEQWGTKFGQSTRLRGIAVSGSGLIHVTGEASDVESLILANPFNGTSYYQDNISGTASDIVIAKFNSDRSLYWGTYYGDINDDFGYSIAVDDDNNIYVGGYENDLTHDGTPPLPLYNNIAAPYYIDYLTDDYNGVILEFASNGAPLWGTLFGGITNPPVDPPGPDDYIYSLTPYKHQIFGAGFTRAADLDNQAYYNFYNDNALQIGTFSGASYNNGDGFVFSVSGSGNLLYSSYFGGDGSEGIRRIYCDNQNLFLVGQVNNIVSVNIPLHDVDPGSTSDFYQSTFAGTGDFSYDGFISEFGLEQLTGIEEAITIPSNSLICFPNPAHSEIYLQIPSSIKGNCSINIFDATGGLIYRNEIQVQKSIYRIDESMAQGMYLVSIQNDNSIFTSKVIVQ